MTNSEFVKRYGPAALVTGASSGIGRSFAGLLASMGMDLLIVARRLERLEELAARLRKDNGVRVEARQIDLADATAARSILDSATGLDIGLVVSNAGFGLKGDHAANDAQAMTDMLAVNCAIPMLLAHGFIPRLRKRRRGGLIFTGSVEGLIGCPYSTAYSSTKAFVKSLGEGLWGELQPDIDVLVLCPGATDTEAAGLQGIDISKLQNVMSPDDVARLALENICNGPVYVPSDHYRASFERLLAMPRRDALAAMAKAMKPQGG